MKIEKMRLKNFRCFGNAVTELEFDQILTTLVGSNGSGKTAVFKALSRLFGTSPTQRTIQKRDFHISGTQSQLQSGEELFIEAIFIFPELTSQSDPSWGAVPEFFNQMIASGEGEPLKARMRLQAIWTDDGTPEGNIDESIRWVRTLNDDFDWTDCPNVQPVERSSIQFIYLPANRDASTQVTALLKGRLWLAAKWSTAFREETVRNADTIQNAFDNEKPTKFLISSLTRFWHQVYEADTDRIPCLKLVEKHFDDLVRKAEFVFVPDEAGCEHHLSELSDGQRSLFHIALTAATLTSEMEVFNLSHDTCSFEIDKLHHVYLTILAVEEPENCLSPFFLSRITRLSREIGILPTAQVILSSHSPVILSRIEATEVRYLRMEQKDRCSSIRQLSLPEDDEEASRYIRLAVKAYPEIYFARFAVLVEGDSERIIIPFLAEKMGIALDPSFVPIVPLGGRYVSHFWKLLNDLRIPYATLLDLDLGRKHGGIKMIEKCFDNLVVTGNQFWNDPNYHSSNVHPDSIENMSDTDILNKTFKDEWLPTFQKQGIFFSYPIDIDFSMLLAFPEIYHVPNLGSADTNF